MSWTKPCLRLLENVLHSFKKMVVKRTKFISGKKKSSHQVNFQIYTSIILLALISDICSKLAFTGASLTVFVRTNHWKVNAWASYNHVALTQIFVIQMSLAALDMCEQRIMLPPEIPTALSRNLLLSFLEYHNNSRFLME